MTQSGVSLWFEPRGTYPVATWLHSHRTAAKPRGQWERKGLILSGTVCCRPAIVRVWGSARALAGVWPESAGLLAALGVSVLAACTIHAVVDAVDQE